jgi:anti-sigma factor RsiW
MENQMPDCRAIKKKLGRYFDGELPPIEHQSVEDHLKRCSRCAVELQEIHEVAGAFQEGMSALPAPSDLAQRIVEKARARVGIAPAGWDLIWFWKNWSFSMRFAAVAVAAAACYIGIVIGSASLPSNRQASDEMKWVAMTTQGPIVSAYIGSAR